MSDGVDARETILNIGCGTVRDVRLEARHPSAEWREVRLDINPAVEPDVVASVTDMRVLTDASVDAVWCSHILEHLEAHKVPVAMAECLRVLKPGGAAAFLVPDLQSVARMVAEDRVGEPLYMSDLGPIYPLDVVYGYGPALAAGNGFMAHRTGFTPTGLGTALQNAGFDPVLVRRSEGWELIAFAHRPPATTLPDEK